MNTEIKPLVPEDWDIAQTTSQFTDNCENDIRQLLQTARKKAYRAVNAIMTRNNWLIGCRIVLQEQKGEARAEYGAWCFCGAVMELSAILRYIPRAANSLHTV